MSSAIAWQGVVPKRLVWALDWDLMFMITVCDSTGSQSGDGEDFGEHGC